MHAHTCRTKTGGIQSAEKYIYTHTFLGAVAASAASLIFRLQMLAIINLQTPFLHKHYGAGG